MALTRTGTEVPGLMGLTAFTSFGLSSETHAQVIRLFRVSPETHAHVNLPVQSVPIPELRWGLGTPQMSPACFGEDLTGIQVQKYLCNKCTEQSHFLSQVSGKAFKAEKTEPGDVECARTGFC